MKRNSILNYFQPKSSPAPNNPPRSPLTPSNKLAENVKPEVGSSSSSKRNRSPDKSGDNRMTKSSPPITPKEPKRSRMEEVHNEHDSKTSSDVKTQLKRMSDLSVPCLLDLSHSAAEESNEIFPHLDFEFLISDQLKDKSKRSPSDEDYDPTSLYVPRDFLDKQTPAHRQWWEMKIDNFDTILFFKMGKFYELFHMDAVIAVQECNLIFMKKDYAHCGFPEIAFERYANILIDRGFKIARIEQVETPKMMEQRCKTLARPTKFDKVVKRKICEKVSAGTRTFGDDKDDFLVSISDNGKISEPKVGFCVLNTTLCKLYIGSFTDDSQLSKTHTLLTLVGKAELIFGKNSSSTTMQKLLYTLPSIRKTAMAKVNVNKILDEVRESDYFSENKENKSVPDALKKVLEAVVSPDNEQSDVSFAVMVKYLKEALIDEKVFSFNDVHPLSELSASLTSSGKSMILFGHTLRNLEILPSEENRQYNIFSVLDRTSTAFGKRMLKHWVCNPLLRSRDIVERQEALQALSQVDKESIKKSMKKMCDFEKLLAWIFAFTLQSQEHPGNEAIFYESENQAKRGINYLISCLKSFQSASALLNDLRADVGNSSVLLQKLLEPNDLKELEEVCDIFENAFDFEEAIKSNKILPVKGMDANYDEAKDQIRRIEMEAEEYRKGQKRFFGTEVTFFGQATNTFQLEVSEKAKSKADDSYTISSQRKGFVRYTTEESLDLRDRMAVAVEEMRKALKEVNRVMFKKFFSYKDLWRRVTQIISTLDCLLSLCDYSFSLADESVFPNPIDEGAPFVKVRNGKHPLMVAANQDKMVIPNDINLDENIFLLTGANMGGKSTIMRQTATLVIMAQLGCKVPAEEMSFVTVDRLFSRMGARDNILEGESTFFVELLETNQIVKYATNKSLAIIDELGRGTSTHDGCAIAAAVLKHFTSAKSSCRVMFTTHYHKLTNYVRNDRVKMFHMAMVEPDENQPLTFLYKIVPESCPRSHGFNAALCAGVDRSIVSHARLMAEKMEIAYEHGNI